MHLPKGPSAYRTIIFATPGLAIKRFEEWSIVRLVRIRKNLVILRSTVVGWLVAKGEDQKAEAMPNWSKGVGSH
jgi:hypothetical protein